MSFIDKLMGRHKKKEELQHENEKLEKALQQQRREREHLDRRLNWVEERVNLIRRGHH